MTEDRLLSSYHYQLPPELIAQTPVIPRDNSRLLVIDSLTTHHHCSFSNLDEWLQPGDLLVMNNTRVIPARLYGQKTTGAPVEVLLLEPREDNCWLALVKPGKRFKLGSEIVFTSSKAQPEIGLSLKASVVDRDQNTAGRWLKFDVPAGHSFAEVLEHFGHLPLPPYIKTSQAQPDQYQTIYAQQPGSVAAPTAGLHFTEELLQKLATRGIEKAFVTLTVGVGTFRPVEVEDITSHQMHSELVNVPQETVAQIEKTKAAGGRIIAVGTTVVRALEGAAQASQDRLLKPFWGKTDLFIYPSYTWQVVEGMITNFHLPGSSLLMLVSALVGRKRLLNLYDEAIACKYRFYSFGDAMLILPDAKQ